jgi:stearoyl-CoA desaturase (Delta-9 desaturase)
MTELIYILISTHITIICVTLYLHRSQAHRAVTFRPAVSHFMRFWLWLTTGMVTKQWVAVHRKHHQYSDNPGDPHSPHVFGINKVVTQGALLYHVASKDTTMINAYGSGTPDDWLEHHLYTPYSRVGIGILFLINFLLFGWAGVVIWGVQMLWIPFWAAGIVNGVGHWWGYRNGETRDKSRNIVPIDFIVGGELLHNNHHLDPASPRLSRQWFEFDIGWMYITVLSRLGLAQIRSQS